MDDGQSVPTSTLIVGSHMLNSVSDNDAECATSLAPLMDLIDIMKARSYSFALGITFFNVIVLMA